MKPLTPNSMIQNRYLVVQSIGKGGMGEVYLSVDQRLGSAVALKRTFYTDDNTLAAAFEREARILARLRHPVLPKVIDHFVENGDQFLVMEHISGDDIAKRLELANKPFPLSWVMFWADQLLDALSYLHSHEPPIIHRDIKPQNLKLTDENHIVLLDFGLSKDFDTKATSNPLNSASVAGYSPHFASMEQIRGTGTDARSDLYSLAATLYQLMTNSIPVDALSRADALLGNALDPIKPLNELNPEISPAISEVILKAVSVRQDDRYSTAGEMQKALRRAFDRSKKDPDAPVVPVIAVAPETSPTASPVDSLPSEMKTRAFSDTAGDALDATLQMDAAEIQEVKQADVKTEMLKADDVEIDTQLSAKASKGQIPAPPPVAAVAATPPPVPPPSTPTPVSNVQQPHPKASELSIPTKTKSSSKTGLVVGGLLALLLLGGLAGGGIWYFYLRPRATPAITPSPTPTAQPSPTTAPIVSETNVDANSNANSSLPEASNSTEVNTATTPSSNPGTRQTPPPITTRPQAPPKTAATPAPKATAKPKDDRTVIIQ
ncbi:MAG: protein kinase [Acidobacteria bacterium]|nr:protein kinase [Acidobacteriota bacterium]MBP7474176.1 protein kinase [Pyrinomonadaceae bacterium]MBP9108829.1 protein kinase [Pyrinomonadaceae bacterium]